MKKSLGSKISFIGFCIAGIGYLSGIYIHHNFGAILIWFAFFVFLAGILKTWLDFFTK